MDQIIYVLAIMGCGDDNLACRQARVEPIRYTSYAACQEAMPAALSRNTDVDYPVIAAACQRQSARMVQARPAPTQGG
jgi:hypothetical protein